jgi:BASS family bile acid:Na+ symporter
MRELISFVARHFVELVMFSVGLRSSFKDLIRVRSAPMLFGRAFVVINVLVPALAFVCVTVIPMPRVEAGLLLLMAVCPAAPLFVRAAAAIGASAGTSLSILLVINLLSPLTIAIWVEILRGWALRPIEFPLGEVIRIVVVSLLVPLLLGMAIHALADRRAEIVSKHLTRVCNVLLVLIAVALLGVARPAFSDFIPGAAVAVLVTTLGAAVLGHLAGGPNLEDRKAIAFAAIFGNPATALAFASRNFPDVAAAAPVATYVLLRAFATLPYRVWLKSAQRHLRRPPRGRSIESPAH